MREDFVPLSWSALSVAHHDRSPRWYAIAGAIVSLICIYGILTRDWSLTLMAIVVAGTYFLLRNAAPPLHRIALERDGFEWDGVFTSWIDCKEFWFVSTPTYTELHIHRLKNKPHEVIIQTGDIDVPALRASLCDILPYASDRRERLLDTFSRICKL